MSIAAVPKASYGQILRSTALIGGSQLMTIAIGIVRTKATAVLLGPSGFGLMGLFNALAEVSQSLGGVGIGNSGVRQIATAVGSGNPNSIARAAGAIRWTSVVAGFVTAALMMAFSEPIAKLTFGSSSQRLGVSILAVAVFLNLVAQGKTALIQGTRRTADLARCAVLGGVIGSVLSVALIYMLGERGVVLSFVTVALTSVALAAFFSRRIALPAIRPKWYELRADTRALLGLGAAFMMSGVLVMGSSYVLRVLVSDRLGMEATGLYQAAWAVGGMYVGLILQAMGTDFYPRLAEVAGEDSACNRYVNEQTTMNLLLVGPGVLATLILAPLVIKALYSSAFMNAVPTLRWLCLGAAIRALSWPLGYVLVARNKKRLFLLSDIAWVVSHIGLSWFLLQRFGIEGTGMAFFGAYLINCGLNLFFVCRVSGFRWSPRNSQLAILYGVTIGIVFLSLQHMEPFAATLFAGAVLIASTVVSIRTLVQLFNAEDAPVFLRKLWRPPVAP